MRQLYKRLYSILGNLTEYSPLLSRLILGWVFLWAGYGKLGNIEQIIGYFDSLGIPFPQIQAPFVSALEFIGGALLMLGLCSRIIALLFSGIMGVAILTAHAEDITKFSDVFKIYEFAYILIFAFIITHGPGKYSLDYIVKQKFK